MASLLLTTPAEELTADSPDAASGGDDRLLVATFGNRVAEDYVVHIASGNARNSHRPVLVDLSSSNELNSLAADERRISSIILFLDSHWTQGHRAFIDDLARLAAEHRAEFVCVVSTFLVHLGCREAIEAEDYVLARFRRVAARLVVFRPGHLLAPHSRTVATLNCYGPWFPIVPRGLRSCFVNGHDLFAAIDAERRAFTPRSAFRSPRVFTLLGPNRSWREMLARHRGTGFGKACLTLVANLLALLCLGHIAALVIGAFRRRRFRLDCLQPTSFRELLSLYNPYNFRHVKVVGYNNGVNHFGHRFPGKTVVSTVRCNRIVRVGSGLIKADCGATIHDSLVFLAASGQEPFVVPNYSYVCLGTAFFVPIHGSASDYSTVAETITRILLYDPLCDRLVAASRGEPAFQDRVYNMASEMLLLRLHLRVRPKARYSVQREELESPRAGELLIALRDQQAANVEIRKGSAADRKVRISRYFALNSPLTPHPSPLALELPRDALGRLWDRLEENPVTSFLMHAATRYFAWHVELFFTAEEFTTFWQTHHTLPLKKIQLRYIRRDGLPSSPFRDHDCVSADMFMLRRHRRRFEDYLRKTFRVVRSNPGKHSQ